MWVPACRCCFGHCDYSAAHRRASWLFGASLSLTESVPLIEEQLNRSEGHCSPDFKGCGAKQNTFDGLDVIDCTEWRACIFKAVSSTALHWRPGEMMGKIGLCFPAEMLLPVTKCVLWLKQDSQPGDTGCPGDIFRGLRSEDKLCCTPV